VRLSRRGLLRSGVLALGVEPAGVLGPLWSRVQDPAVRSARQADAAPSRSKLPESDLEDLVAFAELLVVGRALLPIERDSLVGSIEEHVAREPDYRDLCRTTVSLLQRLAGRRFSSLDATERVGLIARHRLNSPDVGPGGDIGGTLATAKRVVRTRARRELIADYYRSPAGWAAVGYDVFPGRCGDLGRYTRPES
jgi:hypothetical protein